MTCQINHAQWLCLCAALLAGCVSYSGNPAIGKAERAQEMFINSQGNAEQAQKAHALASEAVAESPDDVYTLKIRADMSMQIGHYEMALEDYRALNRLSAQNKLTECMLAERIRPEPAPLDCYRDAAHTYQGNVRQPEDEVNYALTLLFAEDDSAQSKVDSLIESTPAGPLKESYEFILRQFDRKQYIQTIFP